MVNKMKHEFEKMTRGVLIATILNLENEIKSLKNEIKCECTEIMNEKFGTYCKSCRENFL